MSEQILAEPCVRFVHRMVKLAVRLLQFREPFRGHVLNRLLAVMSDFEVLYRSGPEIEVNKDEYAEMV